MWVVGWYDDTWETRFKEEFTNKNDAELFMDWLNANCCDATVWESVDTAE